MDARIASTARLTKAGQKPSEVLQPGHDNPQTGPFYVEGAEPGDTLVIRIEKLEPARDVRRFRRRFRASAR